MEGTRLSHHESVQRAYERIKRDGMTTIWDRYEAQGMGGDPDRRCSFCQAGARCDFCSNGPAGPTPPRISGASAASPPTVWRCG